MAIADASLTRFADVPEVTIGTIPSNPVWQIMRTTGSSLRPSKQVDISDEIVSHANVPGITKVGELVTGDISSRYSYGTYHLWLERLLRGAWTDDVLKNGILHKTAALEWTFEQGSTDTYIRTVGNRWNTLNLSLAAEQPVRARWGVLGIKANAAATAIVSGATYTAATATEDFNGALNVGSLVFTGISNAPKIQTLELNINSNVYPIKVLGKYEVEAHGLGRFDLSGSFRALFENSDTYNAAINHTTVTLGFTLTDTAGNSEVWAIPKVKLEGAPMVPGNNQPVPVDITFQAFYDSSSAASMSITRTAA